MDQRSSQFLTQGQAAEQPQPPLRGISQLKQIYIKNKTEDDNMLVPVEHNFVREGKSLNNTNLTTCSNNTGLVSIPSSSGNNGSGGQHQSVNRSAQLQNQPKQAPLD